MEETVIVQFPNQAFSQIMHYRAKPGEGDDEVALRLSERFAPGTVLGIDGAKWKVEGPFKVTLVYDPIDGLYPKGNPHIGSSLASLFEELGETEEVEKRYQEKKAALDAGPYPVGSEWRPRDPRRKATFKVVKVADNLVHTDDGRNIQVARMFRYDRV